MNVIPLRQDDYGGLVQTILLLAAAENERKSVTFCLEMEQMDEDEDRWHISPSR